MNCRFCNAEVTRTFVDLGMQPLSNAYVPVSRAEEPETFYPLHARVCDKCLLIQLPAFETPDRIFGDYAYLSSVSTSWLEHSKAFAAEAQERFGLGPGSLVVEIASNDGYLLRFFKERGIPVLGVEPANNVAAIAERNGIPTLPKFFSRALAEEVVAQRGQPDLVVANNVLAHVPDLNDFVAGLARILGARGVLSIEVPHLLRLMLETQFDTIYHEHFSYFSLATLIRVLKAHALQVFDVEELQTHGGSIRVFAEALPGRRPLNDRVNDVLAAEKAAQLDGPRPYEEFAGAVQTVKRRLLSFLIAERDRGHRVVGYGAPAKGNTLLNYCGVRSDLLEFTVDRNPLKQGALLPGSRIPIAAPDSLDAARPNVILVLPWNIRSEIQAQLAHTKAWGARLFVPIPTVSELT